MQLDLPQLNSNLFRVSPATKRLDAARSELKQLRLSRFSDVDTAKGLALRNPTTGRVTQWVLAGSHISPSGNVAAWRLVPTEDTKRRYGELVGYTMYVAND